MPRSNFSWRAPSKQGQASALNRARPVPGQQPACHAPFRPPSVPFGAPTAGIQGRAAGEINKSTPPLLVWFWAASPGQFRQALLRSRGDYPPHHPDRARPPSHEKDRPDASKTAHARPGPPCADQRKREGRFREPQSLLSAQKGRNLGRIVTGPRQADMGGTQPSDGLGLFSARQTKRVPEGRVPRSRQ